jgi:hypothetical protein
MTAFLFFKATLDCGEFTATGLVEVTVVFLLFTQAFGSATSRPVTAGRDASYEQFRCRGTDAPSLCAESAMSP